MLYSFDIFDTCLVRTCGNAENLFYLLANVILGEDAPYIKKRDFVRLRKEAEISSLTELNKKSVTIEEIYNHSDFSYYTDMSASGICAKEIELENRVLVPVVSMRLFLAQCRNKGKVVFISDMWLSSATLKHILEKYGLFQENDSIYVSSEYDASKADGTLFDIVKEKEGVEYSNWTHFGDNAIADVRIPKQKGIRVKRIYHEPTGYETMCEANGVFSNSEKTCSFFSGLLRSVRLSTNYIKDGGFLSDVMCGMIVPFVLHCLNDAKKRGIQRLYFASRDAYIFYLVAKEFQEVYPEIEFKYLYISTKVVYPSLLKNGTEEELRLFLSNIALYKPKPILKMLGFSDEDMSEIAQELDINEKIWYNSAETDKLIELILDGERKNQLVDFCTSKTDRLIKYLKQESFWCESDNVVGLVDVGWRCTTQRFLKTILPNRIMNYYLGVSSVNFREDEMDGYETLFCLEDMPCAFIKLFESYICSNLENTTIDYFENKEGKMEVCLAKDQIDNSRKDDFNLRKAILVKACDYVKHFNGVIINNAAMIFKEYSLRVFDSLSSRPSRETVTFLSTKLFWDHYQEPRHIIVKVNPFYYYTNIIMNRVSRQYALNNEHIWVEGSLCYTYGDYIFRINSFLSSIIKPFKPILKSVLNVLRFFKHLLIKK